MTRALELMAAGVNVAFGHDCVIDPCCGLGQADTLEVAHMGLHVPQMTSHKRIRACFDAVTTNVAKVMRLQGYGLEVGCNASFVLLRARDAGESSEGLEEGSAGGPDGGVGGEVAAAAAAFGNLLHAFPIGS